MVNFYEVEGTFGEDPCVPLLNTGFFDKVIEMKNIKGIFVGHDHNNDY